MRLDKYSNKGRNGLELGTFNLYPNVRLNKNVFGRPPDLLSHRQTQKPVLPQAVRGNTIRIIAHELPCSAPREAASSLRMPVQAQSRGVRGVVGTLTPILPEEETLALIQACSWTGCPGPGHLPAPALLGM